MGTSEVMTKALADKILGLNIEEKRIQDAKWEIRRGLGLHSWEDTCTEAMKFLLKEKSGVTL